MKEEVSLPDNAFRPLKEGEEYEPLMKPNKQYREVTPWSIVWGLLMAVIFSAATAYLGLKVGQVFEAAIPITIIAVGVSGATHRKDPLGENIIIQSIGACSGMIVAGAIFTLPALYILQHKYPELTVNFLQVFLSSVLGGILGILFLIPFRKYFVKDMHGKYPFPEATASTQVLISGERSGSQAKPLLVAGIVGGLFDFAVAASASPEQLFSYAKSIGIGGIAMAGIIGVIKSWGVIKSAFGLVGQIFKSGNVEKHVERTQRDISMKIIAIGSLLTIIVTALFFYFDVMGGNLLFTIVGILIVAIIAFLFTTVAANAIAIVGSNPVSGMTLMTLILSSIIMVVVGLKGTGGMVAALIMGGVVCTALSSAGAFITDLKIGYWLGATPKKQETFKFLGILVSAATVGGVIMILNKAYGFTPDNSDVMAAPQARAMAAVIEPLMSGQGAPWLLYGIGAIISIVLTLCGISALAFALGMFIPLQLNLPLIVGGLINWYINTRSTDVSLNQRRNEKGTLLASGFIAGGALMGVVSAGMQFGGLNFANTAYINAPISQIVSLIAYIALIIYLTKASMKA